MDDDTGEVFAESVENGALSFFTPRIADISILVFNYVFNFYGLKSEVAAGALEIYLVVVLVAEAFIVVCAESNRVVSFIGYNKAESVGIVVSFVKTEFYCESDSVILGGFTVRSFYVKVCCNLSVVEKSIGRCQIVDSVVHHSSESFCFDFVPIAFFVTSGETNSCHRKNHHYNQQGNNDFFVLHNCNNLLVIHIFY